MSCLGSSTKKLIPTSLRLLSRKVLIMLIDRSRGNHNAFKVLFFRDIINITNVHSLCFCKSFLCHKMVLPVIRTASQGASKNTLADLLMKVW